MKLARLALLAVPLLAQQKVNITGTFVTPGNMLVTGVLLVQPGAASASYSCGSGGSAVLSNSVVKITNGAMGPLALIPSNCLLPLTGGTVTALGITGRGAGYSGTCIATISGPAEVSPAQATCTFANGQLSNIVLKAHGTFQSTQLPAVEITCSPACTPTTQATIQVTYTAGQLYSATVVDSTGLILFSTKWSIPNGTSSVDVTQLQ